MAGELVYLEAIVGADISSFRRGMAEVRGEIAATTGLSGSLVGLGTSLTLALTVPIATLGAVSLKMFADFDSGMRNINSIMQLPEDQFNKLSEAVLKFGENTRKGSTAAAEALYTIVSAGFGVKDTAEAMTLLDIAIKGAEAGLADTNTVAQILAQGLLAYGEDASFAQQNMDVLTQTVNLGVGSMDDIAASMGQAINISALAGVSWKELNATAAFLTQRGMSFANAYTSINQAVSQLIKPTEGLTAAYAQLGVASGTELIQKFGGLGGALQALGTTTDGTADGLGKLFTNVRALRGAASILLNFDDYTTLMKEFGASLDGVTDRAQEQQLKSFASQFDYLISKIRGFLTSVGKELAPAFEPLFNSIGELFDHLNQLDPVIIRNAISIGMLAAAIPLVILGVGLLLSPIGQLIAIGAILAKAWSDNFLGIQDAVKNALPVWTKGLNDIHLALVTFYVNVSSVFNDLIMIFDQYISVDMSHLLQDVLVGNWKKAKIDLVAVIVDLQNAVTDNIKNSKLATLINDTLNIPIDVITGDWEQLKVDLKSIWSAIEDLFWTKLAKPLGDALTSLGAQNFTGIALGITVIAAAFAVWGVVMAVAAIPTLIAAILSPMGLLVGVLGVAALLVLAYTNNWGGLRDTINSWDAVQWFTDFNKKLSEQSQVVQNLAIGWVALTQGYAAADKFAEQLFLLQNPAYKDWINSGADMSGGAMLPDRSSDPTHPLFYGEAVNPFQNNLNERMSDLGTGTLFNNAGTAFGQQFPNVRQGGSSVQNNQIIINSSDPDYIIRELTRRGVIVPGSKRG